MVTLSPNVSEVIDAGKAGLCVIPQYVQFSALKINVFSEGQYSKAPFPIEVTDSGMVTDASEEQSSKARSPMDVTVFGIDTLFNFLHPQKALSESLLQDTWFHLIHTHQVSLHSQRQLNIQQLTQRSLQPYNRVHQ